MLKMSIKIPYKIHRFSKNLKSHISSTFLFTCKTETPITLPRQFFVGRRNIYLYNRLAWLFSRI